MSKKPEISDLHKPSKVGQMPFESFDVRGHNLQRTSGVSVDAVV
jgi:hypothetical protein